MVCHSTVFLDCMKLFSLTYTIYVFVCTLYNIYTMMRLMLYFSDCICIIKQHMTVGAFMFANAICQRLANLSKSD